MQDILVVDGILGSSFGCPIQIEIDLGWYTEKMKGNWLVTRNNIFLDVVELL